MDFDLVVARCAASRSKPDQPTTDIGVKDGRIAAIAPRLGGGARKRCKGGGRLVCSGFVDTHIHLDKACILGRCEHTTKRNPHLAMERVSAVKHTFTVEDVIERASAHHREMHQPRRHAHAHPCRGRSQGRPARLRRREGADRQVQVGDRPRDLRHAAGGPDQQSRHRRADGRGAEERRDGRRRGAQLRHRPRGADPPRLRDGARVRRRHRHASRQRRLGRGARHAAGLRPRREIQMGRPRRRRPCRQARDDAVTGPRQGRQAHGRCRRRRHGADRDRPLSRRPPHRPQRAAQRGRPQLPHRTRRHLLGRLQQHPQSLHAVRRRPAAAPGQHARDRHAARQRRRGEGALGHDHVVGRAS